MDANWWHKFNCLIAAAGTFEKLQDASWKLVNPGFDSNLCYTTPTSALGFIPGRKEVLGEDGGGGGIFPETIELFRMSKKACPICIMYTQCKS